MPNEEDMTPKYKLVPVEPTNSMIRAAGLGDTTSISIWTDMLAAAPSPPHDPYKALEVAREALQYADDNYCFTNCDKVTNALNQINQALNAPNNNLIDDFKAKYHELLFAVGKKYPNETRHETALRYIQQAEAESSNATKQGNQVLGDYEKTII